MRGLITTTVVKCYKDEAAAFSDLGDREADLFRASIRARCQRWSNVYRATRVEEREVSDVERACGEIE